MISSSTLAAFSPAPAATSPVTSGRATAPSRVRGGFGVQPTLARVTSAPQAAPSPATPPGAGTLGQAAKPPPRGTLLNLAV